MLYVFISEWLKLRSSRTVLGASLHSVGFSSYLTLLFAPFSSRFSSCQYHFSHYFWAINTFCFFKDCMQNQNAWNIVCSSTKNTSDDAKWGYRNRFDWLIFILDWNVANKNNTHRLMRKTEHKTHYVPQWTNTITILSIRWHHSISALFFFSLLFVRLSLSHYYFTAGYIFTSLCCAPSFCKMFTFFRSNGIKCERRRHRSTVLELK